MGPQSKRFLLAHNTPCTLEERYFTERRHKLTFGEVLIDDLPFYVRWLCLYITLLRLEINI